MNFTTGVSGVPGQGVAGFPDTLSRAPLMAGWHHRHHVRSRDARVSTRAIRAG